MAAPNPLSSLPSSGTFPVNLAPSLLEAFDPPGKKRKRSDEELIGLRYAFKPASITPSTPGSLNIDPSGSRQLAFETPSGGEQVFDAKEEIGRSRECVLLWDETTSTFTLHALPTTLVLTLNRSLSSTSRKVPAKATSVASSSSSASVPLATKRGWGSPVVEEALPKKRSRPSEVVPPPATAPIVASGRAMRGGKSLPRKTLPAHAPLPPVEPVRKAKAPAKGRGGAQARGGKASGTSAAGKRGGKAAAAAPPKGKFKSAEIIEDSDDEDVDADADADGGNEMADEFARMVGESLAAAPSTEAEGEDEEEYEEEDDDEGELGGARLVVNDSGGGYDDHSEWL